MLPSALSGIDVVWIGGLVAACTGTALAVVGLALPWGLVRSNSRSGAVPVYLTDFGPALAPATAALLVTSAMCAGVCFASRSRLGAILRMVNVVISTLWIFLVLAATTYLARGLTMNLVDPLTGVALTVTVQSTTPSTGAILYDFGTMLLVGGAVAAVRLPGPPGLPIQHPSMPRFAAQLAATRARLRWVMTVLAFGLAVTSIALPWYRQFAPLNESETAPIMVTVHDLHVWLGTYRIGLIACILLYAGALVASQSATARTTAALRAIGMMASAAVVAVLSVGLAALWRGSAVRQGRAEYVNNALHVGPGYFFALAAMIALLVGIALVGPVIPQRPAAPAEVATSPVDADDQ
ncbi:hypothetical protein [Micromonospora inositola]|nr:hypothetical protein [Micromonospora inositola]